MQDQTIKTVAAIMALTILEICAMLHGINGQIFSIVIGALCLMAGYTIKDMLPDGVVALLREKLLR